MARHRKFAAPPTWDDEALEARRREAITDFIAERSAEGGARYFVECKVSNSATNSVKRLNRETGGAESSDHDHRVTATAASGSLLERQARSRASALIGRSWPRPATGIGSL